jgi:phosphoribosylamine---glycine ligase
MRVLLIGSGGREHALAWKIAQSPDVRELWCAPGNPGMALRSKIVPIAADDVTGLEAFVAANKPDLVVVGPEKPLVLGLADRVRQLGIPVFGPSAGAARIEGSKAFAKEIMAAAGIPTARGKTFQDTAEAIQFAKELGGKVVVKADGLAAGKGVVVCGSISEAEGAIRSMLEEKTLGEAGSTLVLEELLIGPEMSCIALCDGERARMLAPAQDHKRVADGDTGPNTGGMGAYSTPNMASEAWLEAIQRTIIEPVLRELAKRGAPFIGALYAGMMLTPQGPKVLEFNARMGDPETQPILMRLASDLVPQLHAAATGRLSSEELRWKRECSVNVVLAAEGYPAKPVLGDPISIPNGLESDQLRIFHAGTSRSSKGELVTSGGRVLGVSALGQNVEEAAARAYSAAEQIQFRGRHFRRDIAGKPLTV